MKRTLRNWYTYKPTKQKPMTGKSCTIPGQATSIKSILEKHSRGIPLPQNTEGQYFGDTDVPDFEGMDLVDIAEYTKNLQQETRRLQAQIKEQQAAQQAAYVKQQQQQAQSPEPQGVKDDTAPDSTISS